MKRQKRFRELRIYAYADRIPFGDLPDELQRLIRISERVVFRFGCKLRELDFRLNSFALVFFQLDIDRSEEDEPELKADILMKDVLQVIIGFPKSILGLNQHDIENAIASFVAAHLKMVSARFGGDPEIVKKTELALLKFGQQTEIVAAEKDTKNFHVQIFFLCRPPKFGPDNMAANSVSVFLRYIDKRQGEQQTRFLFDTLYFRLDAMLGRLEIQGNTLELIPKATEKGKLYLKDIKYPNKISLTEFN